MTGPRRLLLVGLVSVLVVLIVLAHVGTIWLASRPGVDVEIPMRAAERWQAGQPPYLADAFDSAPGVTQPFLYPPFILPLVATLAAVPRAIAIWGAILVMLAISIGTCRRLGVPWRWVPLVIAWPPFAEGILDGNVQILMFAAFVFAFYRRGGRPWQPAPRDIVDVTESPIRLGVLSAFIGAIKVSQPHAFVFVLRHRWRACAIGAAVVAVVAIATLPLTGIGLWFEWLAQIGRASDPAWDLGGFALPRYLPPGVGYAVAATCLVAVWFVPRNDPAPWLGVLSVVGSLSLHIFGLLFLIPAMLVIRREAAIVTAAFVATYAYVGSWAGTAIVFWCLLVITFGRDTWRSRVAERAIAA